MSFTVKSLLDISSFPFQPRCLFKALSVSASCQIQSHVICIRFLLQQHFIHQYSGTGFRYWFHSAVLRYRFLFLLPYIKSFKTSGLKNNSQPFITMILWVCSLGFLIAWQLHPLLWSKKNIPSGSY